jgi:hypothetical protein
MALSLISSKGKPIVRPVATTPWSGRGVVECDDQEDLHAIALPGRSGMVKVRTEIQVNVQVDSAFMSATDYSPLK